MNHQVAEVVEYSGKHVVEELVAGRRIERRAGDRSVASIELEERPILEPQDVASLVSLLVKPEAGWVSGNVLGVDGGEDIVA